jgi:hypothetical protein
MCVHSRTYVRTCAKISSGFNCHQCSIICTSKCTYRINCHKWYFQQRIDLQSGDRWYKPHLLHTSGDSWHVNAQVLSISMKQLGKCCRYAPRARSTPHVQYHFCIHTYIGTVYLKQLIVPDSGRKDVAAAKCPLHRDHPLYSTDNAQEQVHWRYRKFACYLSFVIKQVKFLKEMETTKRSRAEPPSRYSSGALNNPICMITRSVRARRRKRHKPSTSDGTTASPASAESSPVRAMI